MLIDPCVGFLRFLLIHAPNFNQLQFPPNILKSRPPGDLVRARDEQWKLSRQTLSPTFSSSKMKAVGIVVTLFCTFMYTHFIYVYIDDTFDTEQCGYSCRSGSKSCRQRSELGDHKVSYPNNTYLSQLVYPLVFFNPMKNRTIISSIS